MRRLNPVKLERRVKWALLAVSLAALGLLAVAAYQDNIAPEWRRYRLRYAAMLEERATDDLGRSIAEQYVVSIQQNVIPGLDRIDRCVTCHPGIDDPRMADVPQPFRAHPGDYLEHHPPDQFGCTVCHRGQGRSVVFAEAKAVDYHWNYPLLPPELTQSSCGLCHAAGELTGAGGDTFVRGKELFEAKGCQACHQLHGRGGDMGPALDSVGLKVAEELPMAGLEGTHSLPQWLQEHFDDPQKVVAGSMMPPPQLSRDENIALTTYMLSLQQVDLPESYLTPEKHLERYQRARPELAGGEALYAQFCASCHDTGEHGLFHAFYGRFMPAVRGSAFTQTVTREFLHETLLRGRPGSPMPAWGPNSGGLSEEELKAVEDYILAAAPDPPTMPAEAIAVARGLAPIPAGDAGRGAEIYARQCVACHGPDGKGLLGPELANRGLQAAATDGFLFATIAYGRRDTAMPAFLAPHDGGYDEQNIADLVAYVRALGGAAREGQP